MYIHTCIYICISIYTTKSIASVSLSVRSSALSNLIGRCRL